jgi:ABC-type spermidine/putrescine transport system permease subunit II
MIVTNYREKISALWTTFLLGTLFHTQLGLMPLFHGVSIAEPGAHGATNLALIFWLMLGFFVVPMLAIAITAFTESHRYRVVHFGVTVFYTVMNILHVAMDLMVQPIAWYQIALMVILFVIGLLLNVVAFQWMQERRHHRQTQASEYS